MDQEYAKYLLNKTREDYNLIADDFSRTRNYLSDDIKGLGDYIKDGDKILDLGCGNGRLVGLLQNKKVEYIGADNSERLIEVAKNKYPQYGFVVASALSLPFPDNYFDKVFSLAVLHHIPSENFRLQALKEMERVLKPSGLLILTVWNLWQIKTAWNLLAKNALLKILKRSKLDFKDIFYPWKDSERRTLIQRYFHLFTKKELNNLVKKAEFKIKKGGILKRGGKYNNIYVVAEK